MRALERYPIVLHGVSMSLGSDEDREHTRRLAALCARTRTPWVSDHLCFTNAHGINSHDLLPLPYTWDVLAHLVERCKRARDAFDRPFAIGKEHVQVVMEEKTRPDGKECDEGHPGAEDVMSFHGFRASKGAGDREFAAVALARIGGRAMSPLRDALRSESRDVRLAAARAILPVATPDELTAFYLYLAEHEDDDPATAQALRAAAAVIEEKREAQQAADAASAPRDF